MFDVTRCPSLYESGDISRALYAARQAKDGAWPVAGGWLDQTQKCLDAVDFVRADEAEWKARQEG